MKKRQIKKIRDWGIVFLYTLLIYITLPVAPGLWGRFTKVAGNFANYFAASILALFGLFIIFYLIAKQKAIRNFIWLLILAAAYSFGLSKLKLPIERIHFVEYGLLAALVFRALRHHIRGNAIYVWSGVAVFCLGLLDEGVQYILPTRVYDTRDVIVNGIAGILGLLLIRLCLQPELEHARINTNV